MDCSVPLPRMYSAKLFKFCHLISVKIWWVTQCFSLIKEGYSENRELNKGWHSVESSLKVVCGVPRLASILLGQLDCRDLELATAPSHQCVSWKAAPESQENRSSWEGFPTALVMSSCLPAPTCLMGSSDKTPGLNSSLGVWIDQSDSSLGTTKLPSHGL